MNKLFTKSAPDDVITHFSSALREYFYQYEQNQVGVSSELKFKKNTSTVDYRNSALLSVLTISLEEYSLGS